MSDAASPERGSAEEKVDVRNRRRWRSLPILIIATAGAFVSGVCFVGPSLSRSHSLRFSSVAVGDHAHELPHAEPIRFALLRLHDRSARSPHARRNPTEQQQSKYTKPAPPAELPVSSVPSPPVLTEPKTTPPAVQPEQYTVQVGAASDQASADALASRLAREGYTVRVRNTRTQDASGFRVHAGTFVTRAEADARASDLREKGFDVSVLASE
jgi:cell division septation protein DedD